MNECYCNDPRCRVYGCVNKGAGGGCVGPQIPPTMTVKWPFPMPHVQQKNHEAEWVRHIVREEIKRALAERDARTETVAPDGEPRSASE